MFDDDFDAVDWLFMTDIVSQMFAYPVSLRKAGACLTRINSLSKSGSSADMADAWTDLQAAIGPGFLKMFLTRSSDHMKLCPPQPGSASPPPKDDELTVWSHADGSRVAAVVDGAFYRFPVR